LISILLSVFFVSHNAFFEIMGKTGIPRDSKDYVKIIYTTGVMDFIQTSVTFIYPSLMGFFFERSIAESVVWHTRVDHLQGKKEQSRRSKRKEVEISNPISVRPISSVPVSQVSLTDS